MAEMPALGVQCHGAQNWWKMGFLPESETSKTTSLRAEGLLAWTQGDQITR